MAKLSARFIKGRIRAIKNIQKITRAMMLIASCKLARTQEEVRKVWPYIQGLQEIIEDITTRIETHPFLAKKKEEGLILIIVISSERGLCGSFNINVLKEAEHLFLKDSPKTSFITIGKKASLYFEKKIKIIRQYPMPEKEPMKLAEELADYITKSYLKGEFDKIFLVYNEFISLLRQKPQIFQLLPFIPPKKKFDYIYEPDKETCFNTIFPLFFRFQIFKALLSSLVGEYAARMLAMQNATKNAENIIKELFLTYNQARQAGITKEITEITTASEALQ